jgi:phosphoglycolate phosphatase
MTPALVVFDLDGTLVDSRTDLADAANALITELGGAPISEQRVVGMIGEGAALLVRRALTAASLDPDTPGALARFLELYDARLLATTTAYPGTADALRDLATRAPLAILTNKPARATIRILDGLGLASFFQHVIGGDSALGRKPEPGGMQDLMRRAGASAESTLLVGDSPIDLETARRAGTRICLARYGFGFSFAHDAFRGDEMFIDSPAELVSLTRG